MNGDETLDLAIAVIGMSGRVPGAPSVDRFWSNLRAGVESIRDLSDDELAAAGVDEATRMDPHWVRRAADLDDVDLFDAPLFGFTPREAELTDPQFRVFLEDVWTALEDAGHLSDHGGGRIGVFAGGSASTYLENHLARNPRIAESMGAFQTSLGNARDYLAAQVSYRLDLHGPSLTVQTACSTSLVAVHLAVQSLLNRECDVAVAGGVSITVPQGTGYPWTEGDIASPDGRCRAFDAQAAGTIKGNGSGVVVLRRLADAREDGDAIRAVIRGSAINNDGSGKVGFTAPGVDGQTAVLEEALAVADVEPSTIDLVEAHGTGTPLGDPVELAALARAYGPRPAGAPRGAIGSVKSNVGHLDAAAGVVGLLKAIQALRHRELPPTLHFESPNPRLDLEGAGLYVNAALRPWADPGRPRRAAVSSFGIGGTNAHVILEEAPPQEPPAPAPEARPRLLVLSAATGSALDAASEALADALASDDAPSLDDVAFTLRVGRKRLPWRRAVVADTAVEAARALREPARETSPVHDERHASDVVFLFPGQGAQYAGMARSLHAREPVYRETLDRCAELLRPLLGRDLREWILAEPGDADADASLQGTEFTQPALFAVEYSLARLWMSRGLDPAALAGHSIGEYVAACLAGVWSLEDALTLVAHRGRLMGAQAPGAMLAVHLAAADLEARLRLHPELSLAAVNGPSACVAAGPAAAVDRLEADLTPAGVACRRLRTSHAFHSALMEPSLAEFERHVRALPAQAPKIPFLSNRSGTWITDAEATDPSYWAGHLRGTVRFADNLAELARDPSRVLLEVGPGTALTSLARPLGVTAIATLPPARDAGDDHAAMLRAGGALWCAGVDLSVDSFGPGRRVPLPTYPFERQRYWVDADPRAAVPSAPAPAKNPDVAEWFSVPGWKRSRLPASRATTDDDAAGGTPGCWLLLDDGSLLGEALARRAGSVGARLVRVAAAAGPPTRDGDRWSVDPGRPDADDAFAEMLATLATEGTAPTRIIHLWTHDGTEPDESIERGFHALLSLVKALAADGNGRDVRLLAVTRRLFDVTGERVQVPERAAAVGITRVAPQEIPGLVARLVDVASGDDETTADQLLRELDAAEREPVVAWRGGHRWIPSYERLPLASPETLPAPLRAGGAYLLTGGVGPLELALARRLHAAGARGVAFLLATDADRPALDALRAEGVDVTAWPKDAGDAAGAIAELRDRFGRLDAVLHTAGGIGGGMIQLKERAAADAVLRPRRQARLLARQLRAGEELVLFSSSISETGVFGQVDYCAASAFLDAFAAGAGGDGPRVRVVDWGMAHWDRSPDAGDDALASQLREIQAEIGITPEEGVDALLRALASGETRLIVSTQDLEEAIEQARVASVSDVLAAVEPGGGAPREGRGGDLATETERRVADAWIDLLGVANPGRTDSFFDLGGNSLLGIQLASRLRKSFGIELPIATLFESQDLAALAAAVDAAVEERRTSEEVARLLDEIESLPADEIRAQLEREQDGEAGR